MLEPDLRGAEHRLVKSAATRAVCDATRRRFTILAIVWAPGSSAPPHAHHTWCGYAARKSLATLPGAPSASCRGDRGRNPGYSACQPGPENQQAGSAERWLINSHVYGAERTIATHVNR